jgi:hypothetical protein
MARFWWTIVAVIVLLGATERPAYACSCARIVNFQRHVETAPVVVVGQVISIGEVPPPEPQVAPDFTVVRAPFMGTGVTLTIVWVARGAISAQRIRVWDGANGSCANSLYGLPIGTSIVAALYPVTDTPAAERRKWGAASLIPECDYFATVACGSSVKALTADEPPRGSPA